MNLYEKIKDKSARVAVIGLGYVGLPVACEFARVGFDTLGIDILLEKVALINQGICPIEGHEPGLPELLVEVTHTCRLQATNDYEMLSARDVILIAVDTPVDHLNQPKYDALKTALTRLGAVMKPGTLVIIESTIAPGTMQKIVLPILSETSRLRVNADFFLGNCPERVMPGRLLQNLRQLSRVVGGMNQTTAEMMRDFYAHVVLADLDLADCITAELVKTVENSYRDVQIAFANEVAMICEVVGGDVWKVRTLVNKSPFRQMHLPGAGVGGHCIPKDPWLLASAVSTGDLALKMIPSARQVNDSMPSHIGSLLERALNESGQPLNGTNILILGYAYLEESDDSRNSPSQLLVDYLQLRGAHALVHDPYINEHQGDLFQAAKTCDAAVLMVAHQMYRDLELSRLRNALAHPVLIDGRGIYQAEKLQEAGFIHRIIGQSR